jgi:hypothetical protein
MSAIGVDPDHGGAEAETRTLSATEWNIRLDEITKRCLARLNDLPDYDGLGDEPPDHLLPPLDRAEIDESGLSADQRHWREHGYVIKPGLMPDALIDAYVRLRSQDDDGRRLVTPLDAKWGSPVPYMHHPEIRDLALYPPLMAAMASLIGGEMFLHLNLTGWYSTQRDWHQDIYLNPAEVQGWYCAVWVALADVHPYSGPFELIPGSHRWPLLSGEKVRAYLTEEERGLVDPANGNPLWANLTQTIVSSMTERKIEQASSKRRYFMGKKGDVLIWHSRLTHRGTIPVINNFIRPALIGHYSGVGHRSDMPVLRAHDGGGQYAVFEIPDY